MSEGRPVDLLFVKDLDAEELELYKLLTSRFDDQPLTDIESYEWLLLMEISQHRAAAKYLHARLVSLRSHRRSAEAAKAVYTAQVDLVTSHPHGVNMEGELEEQPK